MPALTTVWSLGSGLVAFLPVPVDGQELSCHDKVVKVACKNHDSCGYSYFKLSEGLARDDFKIWIPVEIKTIKHDIKPIRKNIDTCIGALYAKF
jgi:hypothetical protein